MTSTLVQNTNPPKNPDDVFITPLHDRDLPGGGFPNERRSSKTLGVHMADRAERLRKLDLLDSVTAEGYQCLGKLLGSKHIPPFLNTDKILAHLDKSLIDNIPKYASSAASDKRNKEQVLDLIGGLNGAGLISTSPDAFIQLSNVLGSKNLNVVLNAALSEMAYAIKNEAKESKLYLEPSLFRELQSWVEKFRKETFQVAQQLFECRMEGADLLLTARDGPKGEGETVATFRLRDFDPASPKGSIFLYELCKLRAAASGKTESTGAAWFQELAKYGELVELKNCSVKGGVFFAQAGAAAISLQNVEFQDVTIKLSGKLDCKQVNFSDCRLLMKGCEGSSFDGVTSDEKCVSEGSIVDSRVNKDCSFRGYCVTLDMRRCEWELDGATSANERMRGLVFHNALTDQAFLTAVSSSRSLSQEELKERHLQMDASFNNERMLEDLTKIMLTVKREAKLSRGSIIPFGLHPKDITITEISMRGLEREPSLMTLIMPRIVDAQGTPTVATKEFGPSLLYNQSFEAELLGASAKPVLERPTMSLMLLGILELPPVDKARHRLHQKWYRLAQPKDIEWPPLRRKPDLANNPLPTGEERTNDLKSVSELSEKNGDNVRINVDAPPSDPLVADIQTDSADNYDEL